MKILHKIFFLTTVAVAICNVARTQSTITGPLAAGHNTAGPVGLFYSGWDALTPIPFNLEHRGTLNINFLTGGVQRMTIRGTIAGPTTGFVGIGTGFGNPVSLLHLHQPAGNNVFLRFSNAGTGGTNIDGFVVGMLNGTANGDAALIQYEPNPLRFFQADVNIGLLVAPEKMQLTYGGQMGGGTDGLRIFNPGYAGSLANSPVNSIDIWTGINNTTHIRMDNSGNFDGQQNLFMETARLGGFWFNAAPTATQYGNGTRGRYLFNIDSVEVMRIGSAAGMGANVPPGPNSWNVNEGFVRIGEQPNTALPVNAGNRLEIDAFPNTTFATPNASCAGSTGFSGLRLTDLTSSSAPCVNPPTANVLSVDGNGDVILVPNGSLGFGGACPNVNTMTQDFEIPMGNFNYIFSGQSTSNKSRVGIGLAAGNCQPAAKLEVLMSAPQSTTIAILTTNTNTDGIAIKAVSNGTASAQNTKVAGWFESPAGAGVQQTAIFVPQGGGAVQVGFAYPTGSMYLLDVNGSLNAITYGPSDATMKENVASLEDGSYYLDRLRPVSYDWVDSLVTDSMMRGTHYGFIAQEVDTVLPFVVRTNVNGKMSISYDQIIPVLVLGWQEEHRRNDSLESRLDSLIQVVGGCCNNARMSNTDVDQQDVTLTDTKSIVLNQNVPNPFAEQTTISFLLPESVVKAQMLFYDAQGKLIKAVDLEGRGAGQLNVFADDLSNGVYSYALVADGEVIDTKQMVKSK